MIQINPSCTVTIRFNSGATTSPRNWPLRCLFSRHVSRGWCLQLWPQAHEGTCAIIAFDIKELASRSNPPRIAYNAIPCRSSWTCDINRTAITSATCQQECRHLRRTGGMPELQAQAFQQIGVARLAMPLVYVLRASINVASGFAAPF